MHRNTYAWIPAWLALLSGCGSGTSTHSALTRAELSGVYERTASAESVARHDGVPVAQAVAENYGVFTLVIKNGRFAFTQHNSKACTWQYGRLRVTGDRMDWWFTDGGGIAPNNAENKPGEHFVWRTTLYRGELTLRPVSPTDLPTMTWHKVDGAPTIGVLAAPCRPPATALTG
jgi:hypothetical protein